MMTALKPKLISITALLVLAFITSCKKDGNSADKNADNIWTLNGIKHVVTAAPRVETNFGQPLTEIVFQDPPSREQNEMSVAFKTIPVSSTTYKLIQYVGEPLKDNEMSLGAVTNDAWGAYIGPPIDIQITVTNGKLKLIIPEITLKNDDTSKPNHRLSASIYEP